MKKIIVPIATLLSLSTYAATLETIVVSSKTETSSKQLTSSHSIISSEQLEKSNNFDVVDKLRGIPGIQVSQTGGPGSQASIHIRGSEARHVLILVDGVKVNDPSEATRSAKISILNTLDIEKIEILKGAQGVLYGADAIGGVINIITKKGQNKTKIIIENGSSTIVSVSSAKTFWDNIIYINGSYEEADTVSAANVGDENDIVINKNMTLNYTHIFLSGLESETGVKISDSFTEVDGFNSSFKFVDDLYSYEKSIQQIYRQKFSKDTGRHKYSFTISMNKLNRNNNFFNTTTSLYQINNYNGQTINEELLYSADLDNFKYTLGLANEQETFSQSGINEKSATISSLFLSTLYEKNDLIFNVGGRIDEHQEYDSVYTYDLGVGKKLSNQSQVKLHHSTGFKSPSLYQLYVPYDGIYKVGNEDLDPEKSSSIDLTYIYESDSSIEVTLFSNKIQDYIAYDSTDGYINEGGFTSHGIEVFYGSSTGRFSWDTGLSLAKFEFDDEDVKATRRAQESFHSSLTWDLNDQITINGSWKLIGNRYNNSTGTETLEAYDLFDISSIHKTKSADYKIGISNLFDRVYEEAKGYSTPGRTLYANVKWEL